ncbi:hypothetical protein COS31_04620 [Candidatus Roizmanbacteria bacterium CG02_land_8_20_14_3_00_36_15]|uniref:AI-2E family transporter n=2 Tax=Candidatus Roizmaniibacteriota TaxID=1752723 RepID=A0A2M8KK92_9BACT|nr:MAG: hypothetical protein COS51_02085 [Candidatus Roizmanbacteria bacterium CG03_land_8_20_14_0_80_36_21]PIV37452.1 MAG: hypothetical protein COS31_04620 [Candidatus Roizmanbacteria bacterium CG02_land_8_20_14_3_00_36_15]PIY70527.1 MAG: hypothetical protein COY89_00670 [Candidatus Roizmanbacteria bacterium CG_4_10_14_0_8_um_filter_36_36]PJA52637.1 MAG: hypothetical protein CO166_04960 [Candidatus Roizmanbacteria bacterium CG_4_9_14_3_um_filter_36_11]PJC81407.1 MAG: hypothetical protein CO007
MDKSYKIEISHKTIIFTIVFVLLLKFVWVIKDLLFSIFIAFIIMSALKPAITWLNKKKVPRLVSSIIVYLLFLAIFINSLSFIIPPLVKQSAQLLINIPSILENLFPQFTATFNIGALTQYLPGITSQVFNFAKNIFSNAVFTITTFFFGFYFLLEEDLIEKLLVKFFEKEQTKAAIDISSQIEKRMSNWFWGEITLMLIVGVLTYLGMSLIGIKYVLALAVLAGILEVIPNLGPTLAAIPAMLIGFSQSIFLGLAALAVSFIVQQLENNFIVPLVMKKATGLNPIITLVALIVGGRVGGVLGVVLAIPATLFLEVLLIELLKQDNLN